MECERENVWKTVQARQKSRAAKMLCTAQSGVQLVNAFLREFGVRKKPAFSAEIFRMQLFCQSSGM